ncbi:class I SAM-dependent methyltransferase [Cytobacillus firmus]|uniref:class I SAM-dependent methyltransferase n=1 Tax=Cytobacillus firmus TaxID=1399 RepID=UPI002162DE06|nr:class I SAM-dependent methyltransferase [Cytobacillus firmus]MCS0674057.1 class I SAM-dependent methyltransferase [Cytobacillus firmus]
MEEIKNNIRKFWDEQANQYGDSSLATSPDTIAFNLELEELKKNISNGCKVLDIGCGNGIKGIKLAETFDIDYTGIDFSEEMVKKANTNLKINKNNIKGHIKFVKGDVLHLKEYVQDSYDIVITSRCLINLISIEDQIKAITNIYQILKDKGIYLMIENSMQSLNNLNAVRETFGLEGINVRWHNVYIDEDRLFPKIESYFSIQDIIPFASTYYLISRTLNVYMTPEGEPIDYLSRLNMLSAKLPILGDYAPVKLFILKKK